MTTTQYEEGIHTMETLTNHAGGMYNDALMQQVRPEHDFRTYAKNAQVSCSVIPWMSA